MSVTRVPVSAATRTAVGDTNCYVVGEESAVVVDPAARDPDLDDLLADRTVRHVVATHHHPDHVGGVAAYAEAFDATVWCRYGRADAFEAATGVAADRRFREGTVVPGAEPLTVVETPGHAPEHVAFACKTDAGEALLAGDLAVAAGSVVVGHPEGDLRAYLTSLRRVVARDPDMLYPGHGPVVEDPRGQCERLLAHRLDREARVAAAVADGATTVAAILESAYDKDLAGVRDMAAATVRAHLAKLAVEGRVDPGLVDA